ncbi:hypothetical protein BC939DRAFT_521114 [Gamsiella multidivaricata]|uniref:uncharacterized protein n=1 Tax=Gamsiella multidivaricata TaxID=101098 RepID=UPI00221E9730|nr:uncharacterized protein BC939DRAFT_521114 [Gamsiella multidivaricata]KAI7819125.1 hypothetical protein BC939DRAFT_521114 [Gamsiella multidivaricata]
MLFDRHWYAAVSKAWLQVFSLLSSSAVIRVESESFSSTLLRSERASCFHCLPRFWCFLVILRSSALADDFFSVAISSIQRQGQESHNPGHVTSMDLYSSSLQGGPMRMHTALPCIACCSLCNPWCPDAAC